MLNLKVIALALIGISTLNIIVDANFIAKRVRRSKATSSRIILLGNGFRLMTTNDFELARAIFNIVLNEDPLCIATGVSSDESSRQFLIDKWLSYIQQNKSFILLGNAPIAMHILHEDDGSAASFPARVVPELAMYYGILNEPILSPNMSTKYQLDRFLKIAVFWIHKDHRNSRGFQTILQLSEAICVTENFEAISGYFTQMDESLEASQFGYDTDGRLSATEITEKYPQFKRDQIKYLVSRRTIRYKVLDN